ncbi:MAG: alpha/beta fold hydrolase [Acidimicrobiales bacterium]
MADSGLHFDHYPGAAEPSSSARGAWVVLIHGSMDRSRSFSAVRQELQDVDVVTYDRRGYHRSRSALPLAKSIADQVEDLISVLTQARGVASGADQARDMAYNAGQAGGADRSAVVLVGHSFGADVALAAAQAHPDQFQAVVAYEPPMPWAPWWPATSMGRMALEAASAEDGAEQFMRDSIGDRRWDGLSPETRRLRRAEGPALLAEMRSIRQGRPAFQPDLVKVPVVLGCGTASQDRHQHASRELAGALPDAQLVEIPGAGHGAHLSHPAEFVGLVRAALDQLEP